MRSHSEPWMNDTLLDLIHEKDYHHKQYLKNRTQQLWQTYKTIRNKLTSAIKSAKAEYYANVLEENKFNPRNIWKTIKSLLPNTRTLSALTELNVNNEIISNPVHIAHTPNDYFTNIGAKLSAHLASGPSDIAPPKLTNHLFKLPIISVE